LILEKGQNGEVTKGLITQHCFNMVKGLIFDLDQTIVNTSAAEELRKQRNWQKVYSLIPSFILYNGFYEVFNVIKSHAIRCCIVTTSPSVYAKKVVSHFNIPIEFIVDYFTTTQKKPHPDPMIKALELLKLAKHEVISFGDRAIDIKSSNAAGIRSVACTWGTCEMDELLQSRPSFIISNPTDIIPLILNFRIN
jgi:phosphoglycolate phosphatase-like HAD superfamily hydrolase